MIGGGASGLGVALDAVTRGYSVALVEAGDYGGGTSATSTKLIHGGVRYLEKAFTTLDYGQYKLVREALRERRLMLDAAPELTRELSIVIPVYKWWQKYYYGIGMKVYDALAGKGKLKHSRTLSKAATLDAFPLLNPNKLAGGIEFYDGQFNDVAYALALAETADQRGAVLCNHLRVVAIEQAEQRVRVQAEDALSSKRIAIEAKSIVNCTGPFADHIRQMLRPTAPKRLRPSKGIHILTAKHPELGKSGMFIPETDDGRVIFVLPWQDSLLIGTTDTEVADPGAPPSVNAGDVMYLLDHVNRYLQEPIQYDAIRGVIAGYRPLVAKAGGSTEALIRNHEVEVWEQARAVNLLGGKWTTYRQMAEDAVDALSVLLPGTQQPCKTQGLQLSVPDYLTQLDADNMDKQSVQRLVETTQAASISDVLDRRMRLRIQQTATAYQTAERVATVLAKTLGWDEATKHRNLSAYQAELQAEMDAAQPTNASDAGRLRQEA